MIYKVDLQAGEEEDGWRELARSKGERHLSSDHLSSIKCPLFRRKTPRIFQHCWGEKLRESAWLDTLGWCGGGGAQNESSVENGKAFCEKAAGEEVIISSAACFVRFPQTRC